MAIQKGTISVVNIGVDGNDNFLGVYLSLIDLQTAYPTAEAGNFAFVDAVGQNVIQYVWDNNDSQWIAGANIEGVVSVNGKTGAVNLTADDIPDGETANKFVTAGDKTKLGFITVTTPTNLDTVKQDITDNETAIGNNATAITNLQNNKISKPSPTGSFQYDILSRTATVGEFQYLVPKNGVVKLNSVNTNTLVTDGTKFKILNQVGSVFSTATNFPKNISNQHIGQDPINNYATFIPYLYNAVDDKWLENPVNFQNTIWRILVKYTKATNQAGNKIILSLENPLSGFVLRDAFDMPDKAPFQTFEKAFYFLTIADVNSIGFGYEFFVTPDGENITINTLEITRFDAEII